MSIVLAAIAPHGGIAVPEAVAPEKMAAATARGMAELGRRAQAAGPETALVLTPHGAHVEGHLAVVTASRTAGRLESAYAVAGPALTCVIELVVRALFAVSVAIIDCSPAVAKTTLIVAAPCIAGVNVKSANTGAALSVSTKCSVPE